LIPSTFNEDTEFLSDFNLNSLNHHDMTYYWKLRKDIEDSISHDSLIGSTISKRSQNFVSCTSNISSTCALSHYTKKSKVSEKANPHDQNNWNNEEIKKCWFVERAKYWLG
jgi:hypothetical protein